MARAENDTERILREWCEADHAFRAQMAAAIARDDLASLPQDVRQARALLECAEENEARTRALIALEVAKADREERWIAAHEDVYGVRVRAQS